MHLSLARAGPTEGGGAENLQSWSYWFEGVMGQGLEVNPAKQMVHYRIPYEHDALKFTRDPSVCLFGSAAFRKQFVDQISDLFVG
jgi:hypothetical protein